MAPVKMHYSHIVVVLLDLIQNCILFVIQQSNQYLIQACLVVVVVFVVFSSFFLASELSEIPILQTLTISSHPPRHSTSHSSELPRTIVLVFHCLLWVKQPCGRAFPHKWHQHYCGRFHWPQHSKLWEVLLRIAVQRQPQFHYREH